MARKAMSDTIYYGAVLLGGFTAYRLALNGSLGDWAYKSATELSKAWGGSPGSSSNTLPASSAAGGSSPSAPSTTVSTGATAPMPAQASTSLRDLGGVPLVWVSADGSLRQDPNWVHTYAPGYTPNTYGPGAVVIEQTTGRQLQYTGSGRLIDDSGLAYDISAFIYAVA